MTDYKDTLNLPNTTFPMKANLAKREPELLAFWQELDLYQSLRERAKGKPKFILHDGPPYANGAIHLGTTMNKVLKDIIIKSKTLSGFDAPYVPGWDCHGLPIELKVEKKVGKADDKISAKEFRQACREFAASQVEVQRTAFKRLGVVGDWDKPYLTMDYQYEANAILALAKIIDNGHVVRGYKPVHWCTSCASALAEAEVEYKEKTSPAIDVHFYALDAASIARVFNIQAADAISFPIWTTTPWTLPANQAVAVNPRLNYVLVAITQNHKTIQLVLAEDLLETVMSRYGVTDYQRLATVTGAQLEGFKLQHPFMEREVPVVLGEHVTIDAGTGNVHTAPAHGLDDYNIGRHYKLPQDNPVNSRSCFFDDVPHVAGLHVFKANQPIIELLTECGMLLHHVDIQHSYPHCWRHKTPLIFRATPQWFISMEKNHLRQMAQTAVANSQWLPSWGQLRIRKMIESRPDWCISRQRTWGIPIAVFVDSKTGELHPRTQELMQAVAKRVAEQGINAWYDLDKSELLGDDAANYDQITDILDVWFDSGVTHACVLDVNPDLHVPADLYLEGSDQHRGWFQTSLLTSLAMRGTPPFKTVLTHGYVIDVKGDKMSKSLGNVIEPQTVINKLGADILRLWAAAADHTGDVNVSDEILKRIADAYRRIRNTARFLLSNLNDFDPADKVPANELLELDRWAIMTTQHLQAKILTAYDNYHFQSIYQMIHNFCSVEMGSFYLDIIKDRQYTSSGLPRRSGQTAMYHILEALVRWLAPVLSFTAEEIWQVMPGQREKSVFFSAWYDEFPEMADADNDMQYWQWLMQVRSEVNRLLEAKRNAGEIRSALDATVTLYADAESLPKLEKLGDELRFVLITSGAEVCSAQAKAAEAEACEIAGLWIKISVSGNKKCARCWQRRADVDSDPEHPGICARCVENVVGKGECRHYA